MPCLTFHIWVTRKNCNNNLLFNKNQLLSSKQNTCENIGHFLKVLLQFLTIHVTVIMLDREECVIEPEHTNTTHVERQCHTGGWMTIHLIDYCHYFSHIHSTAHQERGRAASTLSHLACDTLSFATDFPGLLLLHCLKNYQNFIISRFTEIRHRRRPHFLSKLLLVFLNFLLRNNTEHVSSYKFQLFVLSTFFSSNEQ